MGIYVAGKVSGAHLNPAVTLALAIFGDSLARRFCPIRLRRLREPFSRRRWYTEIICPPSTRWTRIWKRPRASSPPSPLSQLAAGGISGPGDRHGVAAASMFAITDEFNMPPGANLAPLMVGLVVVAIGMSFGAMHGYAINPARDFGPRLFTVLAGFRNNGITDGAGCGGYRS